MAKESRINTHAFKQNHNDYYDYFARNNETCTCYYYNQPYGSDIQ